MVAVDAIQHVRDDAVAIPFPNCRGVDASLAGSDYFSTDPVEFKIESAVVRASPRLGRRRKFDETYLDDNWGERCGWQL